MSEEKKKLAQECLKLDREQLEQAAGGVYEVKPHCPRCGSERYYSYTQIYIPTGKESIVYVCQDCNHTEFKPA